MKKPVTPCEGDGQLAMIVRKGIRFLGDDGVTPREEIVPLVDGSEGVPLDGLHVPVREYDIGHFAMRSARPLVVAVIPRQAVL